MQVVSPVELADGVEERNKQFNVINNLKEYQVPKQYVTSGGIYKQISYAEKSNKDQYEIKFFYPYYKTTKIGNITSTVEGKVVTGKYSKHSQLIFIEDKEVEF